MQPDDFVQGQRVPSGLQDRTAPALEPSARRALAFDLKARATVGQQKEARRARDQVSPGAPDGFPCSLGEIEGKTPGEHRRPPDDGTEARGAEQIVTNAVPLRKTRLASEVRPRIEHVDGRDARRVFHVEASPGELLIQEPGPSDVARRWRLVDECLDDLRGKRLEDTPKHEEVQILVLEKKDQMVGKVVAGPVALVEDSPGTVTAPASAHVMVGDATGASDRQGESQLMRQRGGTNQACLTRGRLLLEWGLHVVNHYLLSKIAI